MSDLGRSWPIKFGNGIGTLKLGTKIADFLNKTVDEGLPRAKVNIVSAAPEELFTVGTTIDLVDLGFLCHFHPKSEKLDLITCYDISKVSYDLKGLSFGRIQGQGAHASRTSIPTLEMVHKALGPSFPGKFIDNMVDSSTAPTHPYLLTLNGITFCFSTSQDKAASDGDISGFSCTLSRMYVYPEDLDRSEVTISPANLPVLSPGNIKNSVFINLMNSSRSSKTGGVASAASHLSFPAGGGNGNGNGSYQSITLGMSPQDVISILQSPDIVSNVEYPTSKSSSGPSGTSGCAHWRYHYLGLELFFSATHVLFRIICRNNLCPLADFCLFHRCPFFLKNGTCGGTLSLDKADVAPVETGVVPPVPPPSGKKKKGAAVAPPPADTAGNGEDCPTIVAFFDSWDVCLSRLQQWFNSQSAGEVVHSSSAVQSAPECSPYGPTRLYAYPEVSY